MVPVALVGVLLLAGCAGDKAPGGSSATPSATGSTATPMPTFTPSATPTAPATAPATPAPSVSPTSVPEPQPTTATPLATIVGACTSWQSSLSEDAATFPVTQAGAAQQAAVAAAGDAAWQPLASDMAQLVALAGDTSSAGMETGQQLFTDLSTRCGSVGVTVSAG
ncbi:hypothetical protein B7R21_03190 [Subtercola boreus]|uniref:Uncharacterized protein n=1 Tax=Subtercola boreus TaxID=120213 RepID=A0A3E0W3P5_9MICO|nr:hypothetical protein [Subtercola boreus]RFA15727.1 hypothetical protein B7R21_03190 [Subtercola boreus]